MSPRWHPSIGSHEPPVAGQRRHWYLTVGAGSPVHTATPASVAPTTASPWTAGGEVNPAGGGSAPSASVGHSSQSGRRQRDEKRRTRMATDGKAMQIIPPTAVSAHRTPAAEKRQPPALDFRLGRGALYAPIDLSRSARMSGAPDPDAERADAREGRVAHPVVAPAARLRSASCASGSSPSPAGARGRSRAPRAPRSSPAGVPSSGSRGTRRRCGCSARSAGPMRGARRGRRPGPASRGTLQRAGRRR